MKARLAWIVAATLAAVAGGVLLRGRSGIVSMPSLTGTARRLRRTVSDDWDDLFI